MTMSLRMMRFFPHWRSRPSFSRNNSSLGQRAGQIPTDDLGYKCRISGWERKSKILQVMTPCDGLCVRKCKQKFGAYPLPSLHQDSFTITRTKITLIVCSKSILAKLQNYGMFDLQNLRSSLHHMDRELLEKCKSLGTPRPGGLYRPPSEATWKSFQSQALGSSLSRWLAVNMITLCMFDICRWLHVCKESIYIYICNVHLIPTCTSCIRTRCILYICVYKLQQQQTKMYAACVSLVFPGDKCMRVCIHTYGCMYMGCIYIYMCVCVC